MKPNFALNLTEDRITLLHRTGQGWVALGDATFGAADMDAQLAMLLDTATSMSPRGVTTKVVIPNSQIMYKTLSLTATTDSGKREELRAALDGLTPYAVDDLAFDWSGFGTEVQVAIVAQETLDEAEGFAVQYNFRPISFVAIPPDGAFDGEPMFGQTKFAPNALGKGRKLQRDEVPIHLIAQGGAGAAAAREQDAPEEEAIEPEVEMPVVDTPPTPALAADTSAETPLTDDVKEAVVEDVAPVEVTPQRDLPPERPAPRFTMAAEPTLPPQPMPPPAPPLAQVVATSVPDIDDEAPFAEVTDQDVAAAANADDDIPPAPSTAALMAFASRRAAAGETGPLGPKPVGAPPPRRAETTIPGLLADRMAARAQSAGTGSSPNLGAAVTAPIAAGGKKRKAIVGGAAAATVAASVAADSPRKPLTKPGGTFASSAPARGKPRYLGLILTGILILFLALVAAWSSFFLASNADQGTGTDVAAADVPAIEDEMLADGEGEPASDPVVVQPPAAPDVAEAVVPPATPQEDVAAGPEPAIAEPAPEQTVAATETAGPAPETGVDTAGPSPVVPDAEADEIVLSTADTPLAGQQAANLTAPEQVADAVPAPQMAPPPFGTVYEFNANGTIKPVPGGIMTPDGVRLVAGAPANVPPARPAAIAATVVPVPQTAVIDETTVVGADPALADARPRARPASLVIPPGADDDAALTTDQPILASSPRPVARPASVLAIGQAAARETDAASLAAASAAAGTAAEAMIQDLAALTPAEATTPSGSRLAVSVSRIPAPRPRDLDKAVEAALAAATRAPEPEPEPEQVAAATPAATPEAEPEPEVDLAASPAPTSNSVADQATFVNAINLSRINLIGVYGPQSNRYALIRQSNGRYKKVVVGDRIDGGTVAAITANEVRYQKGGRLIALQMPDT
jgi:hypothetical protein